MVWYTGTIPQAIAYAKMKRAIFLVYVYGSNAASKEMEQTWDAEEVQMLCKEHFVPIRIDTSSKECKQFTQIYPVLHVPSTYFIGQNGMPIEILAGKIHPNKFLIRANEAVQVHHQHLASIEAAGGSVTQINGGYPSTYDEQIRTKVVTTVTKGNKPETLPVDEQNVDTNASSQEESHIPSISEPDGLPVHVDRYHGSCRIQFRFPDGSALNREFDSTTPLEDIVNFVTERVGADFGPFTLATLHPRKQFTDDDYLETLHSLRLTPSCVLMVLPGSPEDHEHTSWQDDTKDFLWWLLTPFIMLYQLILSLFSGGQAEQSQKSIPPPSPQTAPLPAAADVRYRGGNVQGGVRDDRLSGNLAHHMQ